MKAKMQEKKFKKLEQRQARATARLERFAAKHGPPFTAAAAKTLDDVEKKADEIWDWADQQITKCDPQDSGRLGQLQVAEASW